MFAHYDINTLLDELGVPANMIMPSPEIKLKTMPGAKNIDADCDPFLPLEIFDDTEFDCRTPKEWLAIGQENGEQKPVPGKALLANGIVKDGVKQYEWLDVGMFKYDSIKKLYQVQIMPRGPGAPKKPKTEYKRTAPRFWIPRIRLMFCAEDPLVFSQRVYSAYMARRKTEILLRYHLYIDCMPTDDVTSISPEMLDRIVKWAKGTKSIKNDER